MQDLTLDIAKRKFELIKSTDENGDERWSARKLMLELGYDRWENFENVISKAKEACKNSGFDTTGHFREVTKTSEMPNGGEKIIKDFELSRYACYLIAQNGESTKKEIALAQTYFAFQTRKQELIEENSQELERLTARNKLSETEKHFSGVLFEKGITGQGMARIRARGDKALFGGNSTEDMKEKLNVPSSRALADFLPTITIKAKDLAAEMTTFKTKEKGLNNPDVIAGTHETHNKNVRGVLTQEGIYPERLPPEEDIKKLERKIQSEQKQLPPNEKPLKISGSFTSAIKQIASAEEEN